MKRREKVLTTALALVLLGFSVPALNAQAPMPGQDTGVERTERGPTTLRIENHNWLDARVYVISGSMRRRIGTVTGLTSQEFALPSDVSVAGRDFQIAIAPIGSRAVHYSSRVIFSPGDFIEFQIENNLALSSLRVW